MKDAVSRAWGYFAAQPIHPDPLSVILWWEKRRIPYNLVVGVVGAASMVATLFLIFTSGTLEEGEDDIDPFLIVAGWPILGGIFFNVCYTAGWVVEILVRSASHDNERSIGPVLFAAGLALSLAIVLLPTILLATAYALQWIVS